MNDICVVFLIIAVIILLIFGLPFLTKFVGQSIEKDTWGDFTYKIQVDSSYYLTNQYKIDEKGCIHFIDNYRQKWQWCEKFGVGEYYFHKNDITWETLWFGI